MNQNWSLIKNAFKNLSEANSLRPKRRTFSKRDKSKNGNNDTNIGKEANQQQQHQQQQNDEDDTSPAYLSFGKDWNSGPTKRKKKQTKGDEYGLHKNGESGTEKSEEVTSADETEATPQSSSILSHDDSSHLSSANEAATTNVSGTATNPEAPAYMTFWEDDSEHQEKAARPAAKRGSSTKKSKRKSKGPGHKTKKGKHRKQQPSKKQMTPTIDGGPDEEISYICSALGMDAHKGCCLRHPNENVTQLCHRYEPVQECVICASEGRESTERLEKSPISMTEIIEEVHGMRADPQQWRERTQPQKWKPDADLNDEVCIDIHSISLDDGKEEVLPEKDWLDQVVKRILRVREWKNLGMTPLRSHPDYARYFRLLRVGIPLDAIKFTVEKDGLDPTVMDLSPDVPLETQGQGDDKQSLSTKENDDNNSARKSRSSIFGDTDDIEKNLRGILEIIERIQIAFNSIRWKALLLAAKAITREKERVRRRNEKGAKKRLSSSKGRSRGKQRVNKDDIGTRSCHKPSIRDSNVDEKDLLIEKLKEELKLKDMEIESLHEKMNVMEKKRSPVGDNFLHESFGALSLQSLSSHSKGQEKEEEVESECNSNEAFISPQNSQKEELPVDHPNSESDHLENEDIDKQMVEIPNAKSPMLHQNSEKDQTTEDSDSESYSSVSHNQDNTAILTDACERNESDEDPDSDSRSSVSQDKNNCGLTSNSLNDGIMDGSFKGINEGGDNSSNHSFDDSFVGPMEDGPVLGVKNHERKNAAREEKREQDIDREGSPCAEGKDNQEAIVFSNGDSSHSDSSSDAYTFGSTSNSCSADFPDEKDDTVAVAETSTSSVAKDELDVDNDCTSSSASDTFGCANSENVVGGVKRAHDNNVTLEAIKTPIVSDINGDENTVMEINTANKVTFGWDGDSQLSSVKMSNHDVNDESEVDAAGKSNEEDINEALNGDSETLFEKPNVSGVNKVTNVRDDATEMFDKHNVEGPEAYKMTNDDSMSEISGAEQMLRCNLVDSKRTIASSDRETGAEKQEGIDVADHDDDSDENCSDGSIRMDSVEESSPPTSPIGMQKDCSVDSPSYNEGVLNLKDVPKDCKDDPLNEAISHKDLDMETSVERMSDITRNPLPTLNETPAKESAAIPEIPFRESLEKDDEPLIAFKFVSSSDDENRSCAKDHGYGTSFCGMLDGVEKEAALTIDQSVHNSKPIVDPTIQIENPSLIKQPLVSQRITLLTTDESDGEGDELMMAAALFAREETEETDSVNEEMASSDRSDSDISYESDSSDHDSCSSEMDGFGQDFEDELSRDTSLYSSYSAYDSYEDDGGD